MKKWLTLSTLLLLLALAGCAHPQPVYYGPPPPPPPPPPPGVSQIAQQGFQDGFQAAKSDVADERPPDVERHERFRNPPVPPEAFEDYRRAFRNGYDAFLHGMSPPPRPNY
jgi:hypothetical protein